MAIKTKKHGMPISSLSKLAVVVGVPAAVLVRYLAVAFVENPSLAVVLVFVPPFLPSGNWTACSAALVPLALHSKPLLS